MKFLLILFVFILVASGSAGAEEQRLFLAERGGIPDQYIVLLRPGPDSAQDVASSLTLQFGGKVMRVWELAVRGFLVSINVNALQGLAHNPHVQGVHGKTSCSSSLRGMAARTHVAGALATSRNMQ